MYYTDIDEDDLDGLPSILTPAMAADTLCVHVNTIYNLLRSGKMTGFRMGAAWGSVNSFSQIGLQALGANEVSWQ